jgi:hypothetical protein
MWRKGLVVLFAALAACSPRTSNDPLLLSQADSVSILTQAVELAADSLAYFGPYDRVWLARESVARDSVYASFSTEIAAALEASTNRLRVSRREADFLVCPTAGPRSAGDCDLRDDGLWLNFEGLRTTRDSLGISITLGVGEPRGRGDQGWHAFGYGIDFRWQDGRWVPTGISTAWEV